MYASEQPANAVYYHGTRTSLATGELLSPRFTSNFGKRAPASWIYFTATLDAAIWGAELAQGDSQQRIYIVRPTGDFVDDPNLTDKKFPGNMTQSYRSRAPLQIVGEVEYWEGHDPEQLLVMKEVSSVHDRPG